MADVHSATMMGRQRNPSHWYFTCLRFIGLNWPLLLLLPVGLQLGQIKETTLVLSVFMTGFLTAIAYGVSRRTRIGSAMPVLLAGILSLPMIVVIGYVVRGETYERAIDNEMLSLFDAASVETDAFSVANPFFDLSSLIWRDDVSYTLFPKLGHKDRLCAAPLITRDRNGIAAPPPIWAVVSIKSILRSAAVCEAQLQSLFSGPIVFKRIPGGLRFQSDETVRPENRTRNDNSHIRNAFKVMEPPMLSTVWLWILLTVVVLILNVVLFHTSRLGNLHVEDAHID